MRRIYSIFVFFLSLLSCQQENTEAVEEKKVKSDTVRTIKLYSSKKFLDKNIRSLSLFLGGKTQRESNDFGDLERKSSWFRYSAFLGEAYDEYLNNSGDSLYAMRRFFQDTPQYANTPIVAIGRISEFLPLHSLFGDHHHFFLLGNEDIDELPVLTALNDENRDLFLQTMINYFRSEWKEVLGIKLESGNKHRLDKIRNALPPLIGMMAMCNYEVLGINRIVLRSTGRFHPRSEDVYLGDIQGFSITYRIPEDSVLKEFYYLNINGVQKGNTGLPAFLSSLNSRITYYGSSLNDLLPPGIESEMIVQSEIVVDKYGWVLMDSLSADFKSKLIFANGGDEPVPSDSRADINPRPFLKWPSDRMIIYLK